MISNGMKTISFAVLSLLLFAEISVGSALVYKKYLELEDQKSRQTELAQEKAKYERQIQDLNDHKKQCFIPEGCPPVDLGT